MPQNAVCKLHKSIYELKQASQEWFTKFSNVLLTASVTQSQGDHSLFTKLTTSSAGSSGASFVALLVYVDNIVIIANND